MDSSSPSIPSRPNPKPRNSETGDLMRRSFRASPFPGKLTRGAESGDKENQISDAVVKAPKASKNFMSPTISAVSKINPSPRKKILSDKNELSRSFDKTHHQHPQVRSSVTFCDVVSFIGEEDKDKDQIFICEKKKEEEGESHDVTVTDMDDSSFDVSPLPASVPFTFPAFEANEVDASVTPYDPKKNYLSPRPQFLHYRPNPRLEHASEECKQLEEIFSSDSSSADTDLSGEESQQEEEVASQQSVEAEESQHEEEVACQQSVEAVESQQVEEGVVAVEEEGEVTLEEIVVGESTEEAEETHQVPRQSRFKISKLLGWILVLGVAYTLLVSSVTIIQPNISQASQFYKFHIPPEITTSARESFEQLSEKLGMWAGSSLVYMDKLISSLREEEGYGPFQFHNLTGVLEETRLSDAVFQPTSGKISVARSLVDSLDVSIEMDTEEENGVTQEPEELESSGETELEDVYEEDSNELEQESEGGEITLATVTEMNVGEVYSESLSEEEESGGQDTDGVEEQREYEENEVHEHETTSAQNDEKMMEESESTGHHLDDVEPAAISGHQQEDTSALANSDNVPEEGGIGETGEASLDVSAETSDVDGNDLEEESGIGEELSVNAEDWKEILLNNQKKVIVLVSTVLVMLAAAAAFLLANKKVKPVMQEEDEPTTISDAKEVNVEHAPVENLIKERLSSLNFQEEEEEVNDDRKREEVSSFPSEMSFSFHKDKSLRSCSNRDELKEYQSGGGRKSNDSGESMASSASEYSIGGSVSYGSFTTYEKIQKRSGRKEEEMVTPVRRSSRIRNHQHSGQ
ncbi:BnaA06g11160D [Brassica napus]|uniref:BnaA06g11160D protein n=1 Tax=Brassica napus TaxID=3708 RepID=A0A078HBJ5_BRANA|nr:BnaA06g11160D [Brassica napus]